jgi:hypothetical protein
MRSAAPALLLAILAGCGPAASPSEESSTQPSQASASVEASEAPSGPPGYALADRLEASIAITGADYPFVAFDSLWVVAGDSPGAIDRIDPATNEIVADIPLPGVSCTGAVAAFDAVWACSTDGIVRIDPATNTVTTLIPLTTVVQARLAAGGGSVWAFATEGDALSPDALYRIDPSTNSVATTVDLGHNGGTMAYAFDALWVTAPRDGLLLRVDPISNAVTTVAEGLPGPFVVVAGPDSLWVSLYGDCAPHEGCDPPPAGEPSVLRIDPATGETIAAISTGAIGISGGIYADGVAVWVRSGDVFLTHIDPLTNEIVETIIASKGPGDVTVGFGAVWATGFDFHGVWRVTP